MSGILRKYLPVFWSGYTICIPVQFGCSVVSTLCNPTHCSTPDFPICHQSQSLLKLMSIELVMPPNSLILCHPLLLLPSIFPSIRVFSQESVLCIRWPKEWGFSISISPSNEYSGLISFRIDWFYLLAVQGTLKSFLQHHSSKASILWCSNFFTVQLSHPYLTTGKTIALTRWTFVNKVMSVLFHMLSRLVNKLWKILKEMVIPAHLTCILRNLYAGQEATVRTGHGTTDCFQIRKGVCQGCILSPCLFNLYAEYIKGPCVHKVLSVPSESLLPQSCVRSVIKPHWPPKSNPLGALSPFAWSPGWEICCGS